MNKLTRKQVETIYTTFGTIAAALITRGDAALRPQLLFVKWVGDAPRVTVAIEPNEVQTLLDTPEGKSEMMVYIRKSLTEEGHDAFKRAGYSPPDAVVLLLEATAIEQRNDDPPHETGEQLMVFVHLPTFTYVGVSPIAALGDMGRACTLAPLRFDDGHWSGELTVQGGSPSELLQ